MAKLNRGIVHIYTGNGKGKTTAAIGLAIRASGAGLRVCMHQFVKDGNYSEIRTLKRVPRIDVKQCGRRCFIKGKPDRKDIKCAQEGFKAACKDIFSGKYDIVILDEINIALKFRLIKAVDLAALMDRKPDGLELVLTGRYCPASILKRADLITEMKEIRHPYSRGILARRGIEY